MTEQDILDNAPERATHVDEYNCYWVLGGRHLRFINGEFDHETITSESFSSLADIKIIVDLRAENEANNREQQIKTLEALSGFAWECGMKGQAGDVVWLSDIQDAVNKLRQGDE